MKKKIRLIWQFSGFSALKIAEHHLAHLNEYVNREKISVIEEGTETVNEFSATSYVVIDDIFFEKIRLDLKPHQVFLYK